MALRGVDMGNFWGANPNLPTKKTSLKPKLPIKKTFHRVPTSASTNGVLQIYRQAKFLEGCGTPTPPIATPLMVVQFWLGDEVC